MQHQTTNNAIDHVFRKSHGYLVSSLLAKYSSTHITEIENAVMESYYKALKTWPLAGIPDNPSGWLFVASNNALLDKHKTTKRRRELLTLRPVQTESTALERQELLADPELNLLFKICHPELSQQDQLAFMLKSLAGFGLHEIAAALLSTEETIKKRLARARKRFERSSFLIQDWQSPDQIERRRSMVHQALYLLFNEGFYSSHSTKWVKKESCVEAIRLCKFLCDSSVANHDSYALLSLMCFHISRFESRLNAEQHIISFEKQDRNTWNPYFIKLGGRYLQKSAIDNDERTALQIEALIAAHHAMSKSFASTDWPFLHLLYSALYKRKPTDLVLMNLIAVCIRQKDFAEAERLFKMVEEDKLKKYKTTYCLLGAELYKALQNNFAAKAHVERALQHVKQVKEKHWIEDQFKIYLNN